MSLVVSLTSASAAPCEATDRRPHTRQSAHNGLQGAPSSTIAAARVARVLDLDTFAAMRVASQLLVVVALSLLLMSILPSMFPHEVREVHAQRQRWLARTMRPHL
jgi:hypothetical protein